MNPPESALTQARLRVEALPSEGCNPKHTCLGVSPIERGGFYFSVNMSGKELHCDQWKFLSNVGGLETSDLIPLRRFPRKSVVHGASFAK